MRNLFSLYFKIENALSGLDFFSTIDHNKHIQAPALAAGVQSDQGKELMNVEHRTSNIERRIKYSI